MRYLTTLYKILHKRLKEKPDINKEPIDYAFILCKERIISSDELAELIEHLKSNKPNPNRHKEFFNYPMFEKREHVQKWWKTGEPRYTDRTLQQQRLFIQKMKRITR